MINSVDLIFVRKLFSVILRDGSLIHIYAEECIYDNEHENYCFRISNVNVCILGYESIVDIKEDP